MQVELGDYLIEVAESYGPRITGFKRAGGVDLFARLGVMSLPHPEGEYVFGGGHRLWASPEEPAITYWPDDGPVGITNEDVLVMVGAAGPFGKTMTVESDGDQLLVTHRLRNISDVPRHAAPWAITQLVSGGTAFLPVGKTIDDRQASTTVIAWPYTRFDDPTWTISNSIAVISGTRADEFKVGAPLEGRAMAYLHGSTAFCKTSERRPGTYPDRGASGQVYVNADFVELETLGPLTHLDPNEEAVHRELWWSIEGIEDAEHLIEAIS